MILLKERARESLRKVGEVGMIREYIVKISDEVMEEDVDLFGTVQKLIRCKDCKKHGTYD